MPPTRGWGGVVSPPAPLRAALLPVFLSLPFPSLLPFLFFHRRGGRRARQPLGCSEISRPPSTPAAQMQWITLMVLLFISSVEMLAQNRWKKQGRVHAERGYLVLPRCHPWVASGPQRGAGGVRRGSPSPRGCFIHGEPPGLFPTSVRGEGKAQPQRHHLPCANVVPPGVAGDRGQLVARGPKSQPPGAGCGWWAQGAALCRCFCSMPWVQNVLGGCSEELSPAPSFAPELLLGCPGAVPGGTGSCPLRRVVPPQPGLCAVRDQGSLF